MARSGVVGTSAVEIDSARRSPDRSEPRARTAQPDASARRDASLVAIALLTGLAVRIVYSIDDHVVVSPDEATYLTSGLNIWNGHGFTTLSGVAELHFPPGLPFVLGAVHEILGGDPHTATLVVNVVTTTLLILPIAGIASLVAGRRAGVLAAWVAALCPATAVLALSAGGSAGLFALLVVTALWLGLRCTSWRGAPAGLGAVGAGLLVGAAYLVRPEGIFYAVVLVPVLALPALGGWRAVFRAGPAAWRQAGGLVAAFVVPLVLLVAPYVAYLHHETGSWELTAKSNAMSLDAWRALAGGDRAPSLAEQFSLDRSGFRLRTPRDVGDIVRDDPIGFLDVVRANAGQLVTTVAEPSTTPYPNWSLLPVALVGLAAFGAWRYRHDRVVLATLSAVAVTVATPLSYFVQDRYLIPAAALASALVAIGALALPRRWIGVTVVATFVLLVSSTATGLYSPVDGWFHPNARSPERELVGRWIARHSEPGDFVMGTSPVVGYYARRKIVPVPYASRSQVVAFGRHYGVRYLVVDRSNTVRFRPQLAPLLAGHPGPGLRAVYGGHVATPSTVIYELVPRPPRFHGLVPLLDHIGEAH